MICKRVLTSNDRISFAVSCSGISVASRFTAGLISDWGLLWWVALEADAMGAIPFARSMSKLFMRTISTTREVGKRTERPILEHKSDQRFLSLFLYSHHWRLGTVLMLAQSVFEKKF